LTGILFWLDDNLKAEMTDAGSVKFTTPHGTIETATPEIKTTDGSTWVHWSFVYNPQSKDNGMAMYRHGKRCDTNAGCIETSTVTPMTDPSRLWVGNSPHLEQNAPRLNGNYVVVHSAVLSKCDVCMLCVLGCAVVFLHFHCFISF
jgi:hypothetical protein